MRSETKGFHRASVRAERQRAVYSWRLVDTASGLSFELGFQLRYKRERNRGEYIDFCGGLKTRGFGCLDLGVGVKVEKLYS